MITTNTFISQSDFANVVYLPTNFDYARVIKPCVLEAQQHDIRVALGKIFYDNEVSKILDNGASADVGNLTVSAYNNILNNLKFAVLYFAHARYLRQNNQIHTRTGLVTKSSQYSDPVDAGAVERRAHREERKAFAYINDIKAYMAENTANYTTYFQNETDPSGRDTAITFWTLKEDDEIQKPGTPTVTTGGIGTMSVGSSLTVT